MRQAKQSDSPSGYDREVRPKLKLVKSDTAELDRLRARVAELEAHEAEVRRTTNARWERGMQACLPVVDPQPCDFEGCVE